jgi:L-rhamnose mutarotase
MTSPPHAAPATPTRHVLLLDLIDDADLIAAYEKYHSPGAVPPGIVASIHRAGILSMEIYRHADRLVMLMQTAPHFDGAAKAASDAADPEVRRWEALMDEMQRRLATADEGVKWVPTRRIFSLAEQTGTENVSSR